MYMLRGLGTGLGAGEYNVSTEQNLPDCALVPTGTPCKSAKVAIDVRSLAKQPAAYAARLVRNETPVPVLIAGGTKPWYSTWWGLGAILLGLYGGYRFLLK